MSSTAIEAEPPHARKAAILAAALVVFADKGIEAATIDDICRESRSSVGSLYHHFGNKEGIAAALLLQSIDDYWAQLMASVEGQPDARRTIHALLAAHMGWIGRKPDAARLLFSRRQAVGAEHEQAIRQHTLVRFKGLFDLLKPWFRSGELRRLPAELYAPLLMGPAQEVARDWLRGRTQLDPRAVVDELALAAWRSLASDPGREPASGARRSGAIHPT